MKALVKRVLTRLFLAGVGYRSSRFRDYSGRKLDAAAWLYVFRAVSTTLAFKLVGRRPQTPWLGFRAIKVIEKLLKPDSTVLEFGAGMSSVWLAHRCKSLVSIETDSAWFKKCKRLFDQHALRNVDLRLIPNDSAYPACENLSNKSFDFVLVDGVNRLAEASTALQKVRPGGYVFLDNSDVPDDTHQQARAMLIKAGERGTAVRIFTDFYPTYFGASQGILVKMPL